MAALVVPDVAGDFRAWLRNQPDLRAIHAGRVFFRYPDKVTYPACRVYATGGPTQVSVGGDTPMWDANVAVEVLHNQDSGYQQIRLFVRTLGAALFEMGATMLNPTAAAYGAGDTLCVDAVVTNALDSPDPAEGWPRYVCDCRLTVVSALAAG